MEPFVVWLRHLLGPRPESDLEALEAEARAARGLDVRAWINHRGPRARKAAVRWRPRGIRVVRGPARGPGAALVGPLLDPRGKLYPENESNRIRVVMDWDARDLRDPRVRRAVAGLARRMRMRGALLGLGARDIVLLDPDPRLDRARQVAEMLHAGFIRSLGPDLAPENPLRVRRRLPGAYRAFGDPIPGLYAVDPAHPRFQLFRSAVSRERGRADLDGYAGDPHLVMRAALLAPIASVVVPVRPEPGPRGAYSLRTIGRLHREISKTSIGPAYRRWMEEDSRFPRALARRYPRATVGEVRRWALGGLGERP
ncbi:MAG: hypothetical protein QXT68_04095 [Halobacteria archaeon]